MKFQFQLRCSQTQRRAFTLVELMVVIAVLGVIVGIMLPAIQAARESSRAASCRNNLKQIGLALANYEAVFKHYPTGAEGRYDPMLSPAPMYGFSWWPRILPYLEQGDIVQQLDRFGANAGYVLLSPHNGSVINGFAPAFWFCPSSSVERFVTAGSFQVAAPSYAGISGATNHDGFYEQRVSRCCRSEGQISGGGILFPNDFVGVQHVRDGLSNTLLVGEQSNFAFTDSGKPKRIGAAFVVGWLTGTHARGVPPEYGDWLAPSYNLTTVRYKLNEQRYDLPGIFEDIGANNPLISAHAGVVNLLYGDGSVHATADSVDIAILKSAATRDDATALDVARN
jgi:prepilin-type N-terminal cleavage/methylation domain-containing protein